MLVAQKRAVEGIAQAFAGGMFTGFDDVGVVVVQIPVGECRRFFAGDTFWCVEVLGAWQRIRLGRVEPRFAVGSVNFVRSAAASEDLGGFVLDDVLVVVDFDAERATTFAHSVLHFAAEGIGIAIEKNGVGLGIFDQLFKRVGLGGGDVAENQSSGAGLEVFGQRFEAAAEKSLPRGSCPGVFAVPIAEQIDGNDLLGGEACVVQSGVVTESQIAAEPMNGGLVSSLGHFERRGFRGGESG